MRIAAAIDLSVKERKILQQYVRSRMTPVRLIERSKIILLAGDGATNQMIASKLGITENKVGRWRNRYVEGGLKAIEKDRPRGKNHGGKKTATQTRLRNKVIHMTTQETPEDATHWCPGPANVCARRSSHSSRNRQALLYPSTGNSQELVFGGHDAYQTTVTT